MDTKVRHFLSKLKVRSKGAQRHYKLSVSSILNLCSKEGYENVSACEPFSQYVDKALEKFMEFLYKSDLSVTAARGALFGWAWSHPTVVLKQLRHLPLAAKALGGWSSREPGNSQQPWPCLVADWIAAEA